LLTTGQKLGQIHVPEIDPINARDNGLVVADTLAMPLRSAPAKAPYCAGGNQGRTATPVDASANVRGGNFLAGKPSAGSFSSGGRQKSLFTASVEALPSD
jgi:hypothetical protein